MGFYFWHFFCLSHVTTQLSLALAFGKLLLQVLAEVQKQMGFFDAELKDSRRRAEDMQQARRMHLFRTGMTWRFWTEQNWRFNLFPVVCKVVFCYLSFCCSDLLHSLQVVSCKVHCFPALSTQPHIYCRLSYELFFIHGFWALKLVHHVSSLNVSRIRFSWRILRWQGIPRSKGENKLYRCKVHGEENRRTTSGPVLCEV